MDSKLAALFYVGIIVPTLITILVFIGFLICLYKVNRRKRNSLQYTDRSKKSLISSSLNGSCRSKKSATKDKSDNSSQHSADSAIDMRDVDTNTYSVGNENSKSSELVLDAVKLGKVNHSYQYEGANYTTEAEVHIGDYRKGQYPSTEKLTEEVHSQIKIYECAVEAQMVALQLNMTNTSQQHANSSQTNASQSTQMLNTKQIGHQQPPRYTSTSKLIPATKSVTGAVAGHNTLPRVRAQPNNQLNRVGSTSRGVWYERGCYSSTAATANDDLYASQYNSTASWKPNIAASCASNTDNYSTVEASQV